MCTASDLPSRLTSGDDKMQPSGPRLHPLLPQIDPLHDILHVQTRSHIPRASRLPLDLLPQTAEAVHIVPVSGRPLVQRTVLARLHGPDLPAQNHRPGFILHERDQAARHRDLLLPREQMEQAVGVDDVDLALELREARRLVQEAARDEGGVAHGGAVAEQVVPQTDEVGLEVQPVQGARWDAVEGQFPELLPETAARVQQGLLVVDQAGQDRGVERVLLEGEVQEAELADAGVGPGAEGTITLYTDSVIVFVSARSKNEKKNKKTKKPSTYHRYHSHPADTIKQKTKVPKKKNPPSKETRTQLNQ